MVAAPPIGGGAAGPLRNLGSDAPGAVKEHLTTEFGGQFGAGEIALVHPVTRAIEDSFLPYLGFDPRAQSRVNHDQLTGYPAGLSQERAAFLRRKVAVEVAGNIRSKARSATTRCRASPTIAKP